MRKILILSILILSLKTFGQINPEKNNGLNITKTENSTLKDSIIKIVYKNETEINKKPAYFINDKLVNESILKTLNTNQISSVNVEKNEIEIDNIKYYGKLKIETKNNYIPKLISLNDLKTKYIKAKESQTIFKIDNEIINDDYNNFIVDEKFILKIIVENFVNVNEKLKINIVNVITKTEENIKKSKEIIIRGKDELTINKCRVGKGESHP